MELCCAIDAYQEVDVIGARFYTAPFFVIMADSIEAFIHSLGTAVLGAGCFNQYQFSGKKGIDEANLVRRQNLNLYLQQMLKLRPKFMLVGEAAGYRGCRRSGIPFTSEKLLLAGVEPAASKGEGSTYEVSGLFGQKRGYRLASDSTRIKGESTATMVWRELVRYWPPPLLWNVYPFHPFRDGVPSSNRVPRSEELILGLNYLLPLASLFGIDRLVAVGKTAERGLKKAGIDAQAVRHPSHGGKKDFAQGLGEITRPQDDFIYTSAHAKDFN